MKIYMEQHAVAAAYQELKGEIFIDDDINKVRYYDAIGQAINNIPIASIDMSLYVKLNTVSL